LFTVQYDKYSIGAFPNIEDATKYIYIKSSTVYVPRWNWDSPNPSPARECDLHPRTGGGGTLACGEGLGESQFRRLEKKPNLLRTRTNERMVAQGIALKGLKEERARRGGREWGAMNYIGVPRLP
jgi:hypothetical protein